MHSVKALKVRDTETATNTLVIPRRIKKNFSFQEINKGFSCSKT